MGNSQHDTQRDTSSKTLPAKRHLCDLSKCRKQNEDMPSPLRASCIISRAGLSMDRYISAISLCLLIGAEMLVLCLENLKDRIFQNAYKIVSVTLLAVFLQYSHG